MLDRAKAQRIWLVLCADSERSALKFGHSLIAARAAEDRAILDFTSLVWNG